jgi:hypothetical protein
MMEKPAMDEARQGPPMDDQGENSIITGVERMTFPDGRGYGFNLLDEETRQPIFRLVFETAEDAEKGRAMMEDLIDHCIWYEAPDVPSA